MIEHEEVVARYEALAALTPEQCRALVPLKLAVLTSGNGIFLRQYLAVTAAARGFRLELLAVEYADVCRQVLDPAGRLAAFQPDCTLAMLPVDELFPDMRFAAAPARGEEVFAEYCRLLTALRERVPGAIIVGNQPQNRYALPVRTGTMENGDLLLDGEFNRRFARWAAGQARVTVYNYRDFIYRAGEERVYDPALYSWTGIPGQGEALYRLADELMALVAADRGRLRKCLVLDLDNTLWGGILGEDGREGIQVGGEYPGRVYREF